VQKISSLTLRGRAEVARQPQYRVVHCDEPVCYRLTGGQQVPAYGNTSKFGFESR